MSFLLALGHCTESPFRCLDEYDVFMDPAVRHVATETLLEFAREQSEYQYVLLTPQVGARARRGVLRARARLGKQARRGQIVPATNCAEDPEV